MPIKMPLTLRNKLKTLCSSVHAWSYAIFWRFHPRNSLLLTVEEAYYEEHLGEEIANMHPQVHLLGEGIVGEAAFTGKHSWVHSDGQTHYWNLSGQDICEDDSCLHQQFCSGIKTIVVIPVKAIGVIQFGSRNKILERVEFLEQTQSMLTEIDDDDKGIFDMSENAVLPLLYQNNDLNGMLASVSSASPNDPFPSHYKNYEDAVASFQGDSSYLGDQLKGTMEAQVVLSERISTDVLLKPNSSTDNLISKTPYLGVCDGELSSFDLLEQQLVSSVRAQDVADACFMNENAFATCKLPVQDSALVPLCSTDGGSFQGKLQNSLDNQYSNQSSVVTDVEFSSSLHALHGHSENIEPVDMSEEILKFSSMDDLCHWFGPSSEDSICKAVITLDNTFSESTEFNPTSFDLVGSSSLNDVLLTGLAVYNSNSDGNETSVVMHNAEKGPLDVMETDFSYDQADEWWRNTLTPVVSGVTDTGFSECISQLNSDTLPGTRKRLFSQLGIEELLRSGANYNPINSSEFECGLSSNKRQTVESSSVNGSTIHFTNLDRSGTRSDLMQPLCDLGSTNNLPSKKDTFSKLQAATLVDDSHSINVGKAVPQHPQKPEEQAKPTNKRARPGESTRPRPKDRQQIQDCIKELRGIIPNGGKCSIDSLLDRTIRYMLFLQSVLKYTDKLREPSEPKLIEQENEVVLKDSGVADSKNCGITWAYEVGHETMLCPIIVEDMSPPGQMLIEMLCEVQGIFLEIIDIIRGFGLNILKAKMERKKNKLWARFIVEANRHVTRIDVFWSLVHLLQQTNTSGIDSSNKHWDALHANSLRS